MTKIKNVYVKLVLFYMKLKQCNSALKVEIMCYLFTSIIPQDNRLKEICTFLQWKHSENVGKFSTEMNVIFTHFCIIHSK